MLGIATFQPGTSSSGLYRLYVIRPGEQQIEMYAPSADGSVYPGTPSKRLPGPQKLDDVSAMLIDGDIYLAQAGKVSLVVGRGGWKPAAIGDDTLHPTTTFTALATSSHAVGTGAALRILDDDLGSGTLYAYDRDSGRIVAFSKDDGKYLAQYRLANGDPVVGRPARLLPGPGHRFRPAVGGLDRRRRRRYRAPRRRAGHDHGDGRAERLAVSQPLTEPEGDAEAHEEADPEAHEEAMTGHPDRPHRLPHGPRSGAGHVG